MLKFILAVLLILPNGLNAACPSGWETFKKSCYGMFPKSGWDDARNMCSDRGALLVEVQRKDENDFIQATFAKAQNAPVWIGISRCHDTSTCLAESFGQPKYTMWANGKPNNKPSDNPNLVENARFAVVVKPDGEWADEMKSQEFGYMCKASDNYSPCKINDCNPAGSSCVEENGFYKCKCQITFTGKYCYGRPCDTDPCKNNGQCVNLAAGYQCNCVGLYTGKHCEEFRGFSSCQEAQQKTSNAQNGPYRIKDSSNNFIQTYCQMTPLAGCSGGGWTLVMKINGAMNTFGYSSAFWSNKLSYNTAAGLTGLDRQQTKLPSYWSTPFKELCVGMQVNYNQLRFISIRYSASSLFSLIADGRYRATNIGRYRWKSLISGSSLQPQCNKEGFNVHANSASTERARIGIIGNQENHCNSPDSYLGFGGLTSHNRRWCGVGGVASTCGNIASCPPYDNGKKTTSALGYIFVR